MSADAKRESSAKRNAEPSWLARALEVLTNWCLFQGGAFALVIGGRAALHGDTALTGVTLGAGALLLLGATVDRFESLKGLGIEAKTRQIDNKLAQADDALDRIRELAELVGANLVFLQSKVGHWDGPTAAESYALAQQVKGNMAGLGSTDAKIKAALNPWVQTACGDVLWGLGQALAKRVQHEITSTELARAARMITANAEDPKSVRLRTEHASATRFIRRLNEVRLLAVRTLPDSFMSLYGEVPLVAEAEVAELRAAAQNFMAVLLLIRDELTIPDPERWCPAMDQLLDRAAIPD
jgi:hypothetical protein